MLNWTQGPAVERVPGKVSGAWVFKTTRVPVRALFENLEDGATVNEFLTWFPGVSRGSSGYRLAKRADGRYVFGMSTQEALLEKIKRQPEPVLLEVWHYLKFLTRQREEEAWADVLPSRQVEQEVLDHLDRK